MAVADKSGLTEIRKNQAHWRKVDGNNALLKKSAKIFLIPLTARLFHEHEQRRDVRSLAQCNLE